MPRRWRFAGPYYDCFMRGCLYLHKPLHPSSNCDTSVYPSFEWQAQNHIHLRPDPLFRTYA